ncbi:hypothetical protein KCU61_g5891, partial [Aureobasidium melanogenum]
MFEIQTTMSAARRPGRLGTRSTSWNYSNAEAFNDDMYSNMTFYDTRMRPSQTHYATLPRNFRNMNPNKRQCRPEVPPPYKRTERFLEDFSTSDSGYSSTGTTSPEPPETWYPPTRQNTLLRHPTNDRRCRSDYYFIQRPSPDGIMQPSIEHGIASDPTNPSISFVCAMKPLSLFPPNTSSNKKKRRRITNNDFSKSDADPLTYIRDNCENATRALNSHRKLHNCDCDFAYLDNRKRGTGTVWRQGEADEGEVIVSRADLGPTRPCKKTWFTGWFVRQHLAYHDRYCGCGCFGVKR